MQDNITAGARFKDDTEECVKIKLDTRKTLMIKEDSSHVVSLKVFPCNYISKTTRKTSDTDLDATFYIGLGYNDDRKGDITLLRYGIPFGKNNKMAIEAKCAKRRVSNDNV